MDSLSRTSRVPESGYSQGESTVHEEPDADETSTESLVSIVHRGLLDLFLLYKGLDRT